MTAQQPGDVVERLKHEVASGKGYNFRLETAELLINAIALIQSQAAELTRLRAQPDAAAMQYCDCELSHNGMGIMGRECDCPARALPLPPTAQEEKL